MINKIKYLFFIMLMISTIGVAQQKSIDLNWQTDFEKAKQIANTENKRILIYFTGSDWSKPCQLLNEDFFYTQDFKKIADENFILVRINSPKRTDLISEQQKNENLVMKKMYKQTIFPSVFITSPQGELVGKVEGHNYLHDISKHKALLEKSFLNK